MKLVRCAAPVIACLLVAGCSATAGDAFTVNGVALSESTLDRYVAGCGPILGEASASELRKTMVQAALQGVVGEVLAEQHNLTITDGDRDKVLDQLSGKDKLVANPDCKELVYRLGTFGVVVDRLGSAKSTAEVAKLNVNVNPKYGRWVPQTAGITGASGSLSTVGADASSSTSAG